VNANELTAGAFVTGTLMPSFPVQNQSGLVLGAVLNSLSLTVSAVTRFAVRFRPGRGHRGPNRDR